MAPQMMDHHCTIVSRLKMDPKLGPTMPRYVILAESGWNFFQSGTRRNGFMYFELNGYNGNWLGSQTLPYYGTRQFFVVLKTKDKCEHNHIRHQIQWDRNPPLCVANLSCLVRTETDSCISINGYNGYWLGSHSLCCFGIGQFLLVPRQKLNADTIAYATKSSETEINFHAWILEKKWIL